MVGEATTQPDSTEALIDCATTMSDRATRLAVTSREQMDLDMAHQKVGPTTSADAVVLDMEHVCGYGNQFVCDVKLCVHLRTCDTAHTVMKVADDGTENHPVTYLLKIY